ncbi:MAG: TIGR03087 family PEP-CTERM/XrtA system glycosyltransferase [Methylovulum sp.]|uniref:TIGR03087 family PEP-CTERM/XrtA system glycosyltransferase n=1 Tax=Methylovulum sp. TaxID=1916980 RepID=UPI00262718C6|nr:TIGR03087 family PEP-CTERM/XrtA system glycosyltransferase [Methylovulum sp.]MDD2724996.1 TIGR03087 family PEP-CTERM/XrtA system glycosyltransferase [Methylovulum sp.]MDD5125593.1 TIGR03087 family PEP-CTERM/XrtA system glycosyltransferase [Methylovulum sp.]
MKNLLFLVHRIPFPPNKGDKIRSYHFLKYLADEFNVYLGTFVDDPHDWQYTDALDALCAGTCYQELQALPAKIKSLQGLLTGEPLSLPYYQSQALQNWVDDAIQKHAISKVLIFSSVMARFIKPQHDVGMVVDFVDVDSDKWRQYAGKKHGLARWIYQREAKYLLAYERQLAARAQTSLFVSEQEAALFKTLAPEAADKVGFVNNGVDTDYFSPHHDYVSPYQIGDEVLVFTGAMDYWANIDAVEWFAKDVFPQLQAQYPAIKFYIVGSKPGKAVLELAGNPAITVTGRVDDVRPYVAYARLAIAPLRIARGIQNKVLEAMAMDKTIVATSAAMEGIPYQEVSLALAVSDDAEAMVGQLWEALQNPAATSVNANRDFVIGGFSWQQNVHQLAGFLQG